MAHSDQAEPTPALGSRRSVSYIQIGFLASRRRLLRRLIEARASLVTSRRRQSVLAAAAPCRASRPSFGQLSALMAQNAASRALCCSARPARPARLASSASSAGSASRAGNCNCTHWAAARQVRLCGRLGRARQAAPLDPNNGFPLGAAAASLEGPAGYESHHRRRQRVASLWSGSELRTLCRRRWQNLLTTTAAPLGQCKQAAPEMTSG